MRFTVDDNMLRTLHEIARRAEKDIMTAIYKRLKPEDNDQAASMFGMVVGGLMVGDLVASRREACADLETLINDVWRFCGLADKSIRIASDDAPHEDRMRELCALAGVEIPAPRDGRFLFDEADLRKLAAVADDGERERFIATADEIARRNAAEQRHVTRH